MASYIVGVVSKHDLARYQDYAIAGFRLIDGVAVEVGLTDAQVSQYEELIKDHRHQMQRLRHEGRTLKDWLFAQLGD